MGVDEDVATDFAAMGFSVAAEDIKEEEDGAFEVWSRNMESLRAFLAIETQWRAIATMAGVLWTGLDYTAVDMVLHRFHSPDYVFDDVRLMESEALAVFAEASRER
ncbi:DUF1799 domain-containing protein [Neorhizobium petrolearium]|uniref:DUF1799 domain-containing protein n=1 Tax=Neorhizobium petrolearium TaxID=515361 RepID=UPI003F816535